MRNILLPIVLFVLTHYNFTLLAQQGTVKGIVTIHNSSFNNNGKISLVQDAQVEAFYVKNKPVLTDANGTFNLKIMSDKPVEKVRLKVHKDGFIVLNKTELSTITGQSDTLHIVLAKPDDIELLRFNLNETIKSAIEKAFNQQLNALNTELNVLNNALNTPKNKPNTEGVFNEMSVLENKLKLLNHCAKNKDALAESLAIKYSLINLDNSTINYQKAFNFLQNTHLDSALFMLETLLNVNKRVEFIYKTKIERIKKGIKINDRKLDEELRQIMEHYALQADIYRINYQAEKADSIYQLMLKYDSANVVIHKEHGAFLVEMNQLNRAKIIYEKAINYASLSEDKMLIMNDLSEIKRQLGDAINAEKILNQATDMSEWEIINNKEFFEPIYAATQYNLGKTLSDLKVYDKADIAFNNALNMRINYLPKTNATLKDSMVLLPIYNEKAINYLRQNNLLESAKYFDKISTIYTQLPDSNTCRKRSIAQLKNNYAQLFAHQKDTLKTINAYLEELAIYKDLMKGQSTIFEDNYLIALNNLSKTYLNYKLMDKTIVVLDTLIILQTQRLATHPQYALDLDKSFIVLHDIYKQQKKYLLIDSLFKMRTELHKIIVKRTPQYKTEMCQTLLDFAAFCKDQNRYDDALKQQVKIAEIQREIADKEPITHSENLQKTLQFFVEHYDGLIGKEIFEKKIKALTDTQKNYRNEQIETQIKLIAAYEKSTIKDKQAKLNTAFSQLGAYYLSIKKIKEAELTAQKQDNNAAHFLVFIYGIQDKFNEAQVVLTKISDKKTTKTRCLEWANAFYNQGTISHAIKTKIDKWFETSTTIGLQER